MLFFSLLESFHSILHEPFPTCFTISSNQDGRGIFKHCSVAEIKGIKEKHSRNIEAGLCSLVLAPCLFHVFPLTVHICRKPWMIWRMRSRLSVAGNPVHNLIPTFPQTEIENVFETFFGTQSVLLKTFIQFGVVF